MHVACAVVSIYTCALVCLRHFAVTPLTSVVVVYASVLTCSYISGEVLVRLRRREQGYAVPTA